MSGYEWDDNEPFNENPVRYENGSWSERQQSSAPNSMQRMPMAAKQPVVEEPESEVNVEELVEEIVEDEEEDYEAVLSDARLRLEQGKLYELIMNNDLFQDMDCDPRAIRFVQREIKRFAKERMEIMLGMRQEEPKTGIVSSPFNSLEVEVLKKLASAASKGMTEKVQEQAPTAVSVKEQPKKKTITPISTQTKQVQRAKPITKQTAPIKRAPKQQSALSDPMEPDYKPLDKLPHEMTTEELINRNREAAERQATRKAAKPANAIPMPSPEQEEMIYTQRVMDAKTMGTGLSVSAIMNLINNKK